MLRRHRHIYLHLLGYLFFMAIRVWGSSFNFIFMSHTYNWLAAGVGVALCLFLYKNDLPTPVTGGPVTSPLHTSSGGGGGGNRRAMPPRYPGLVSVAVGVGALIYLTQLIFGEVSVVTRWAVGPLPDQGPQPHPWG